MRPKRILVAQRSRACRICKSLAPEVIAEVNATIWPESGVAVRGRNYRAAAVRVCKANGLEIEEKSVTRHALHVERTWHRVTAQNPAGPGEVPVHPTDYQSMVERAGQMGAIAMKRITERIPVMEDRELVTVARIGMQAVGQREANRLRAREVDQSAALLNALMGTSSGHLDPGDIPEVEVVNVTPTSELLAEVEEERSKLRQLQEGEAVRAG